MGGTEERPFVIRRNPQGLPIIIGVLKRLREDTARQQALVDQAKRTPGVLNDVLRTRLERAYTKQRADHIGYGHILEVWQKGIDAPSVLRVIGHWRGVVKEVDARSRAILRVLLGHSLPASDDAA